MKVIVFSMLFVLVAVSMVTAQGTYTQIDVPGATLTTCGGINNAGDIAGSYISPYYRGFVLSGGTYTTIDFPGTKPGTLLYGLNDLGQVVGSGYISDTQLGGFVFDTLSQSFTPIDYPGATYTYPHGINNNGAVVGWASGTTFTGFEFVGSTLKTIKVAQGSEPTAYGISGSGEVVGIAIDQNLTPFNFVLYGKRSHSIKLGNAPQAIVQSINNRGDTIVGYFQPAGVQLAGFVYQSNSLQTLEFPGSSYTLATGVNDAGMVVGWFEDANNNTHCFLWRPASDEVN